MVDAPLRACDFRRFLCVFTGDPKIHARRRGGGVRAEGSVGVLLGGLFHPWLSSERLAIRFYYGLGKIGPNVY
jgi:hypothetical protein